MKRRAFLKTTALGSLAVSLAACSKPKKQPNIIFLLTDDQRWDMLGCMGNPIIQTPNIDKLAKDGVIFDNAFVTTSICMTSRASVFTGQYARAHQIHDFSIDLSAEQLQNTYPMILRDNGYYTGFIGKYGVGKTLPVAGYDYWRGVPGQPHYETQDEDGNPIHCTRLFGNQALEFLQTRNAEQPFCLSVSFKAPHVEDSDPRQFISDPVYDSLYADIEIPKPEKADDKYYNQLPDFLKSNQTTSRIRWHNRFSNPELYQQMIKGYYRLISGMDAIVGEIVAELEKLKCADNTIIMLLGDNGFFVGERGFAGKWYGYEESIRVPLVIYDPRLSADKRGKRISQMALNIDIHPTILRYANLPAPKSVQGKALQPLIEGQAENWRTAFLYEHFFNVPKAAEERVGNIPNSEGVRTEKYKYLRYPQQTPVYEELYDLEADPQEVNNVAAQAEYASALQEMRKKTDVLIEELSK